MELGSPAAGVGEDSRLLRREQEEGDLFSGGRNPAGGTPPLQTFRLPPTQAQRVAMATAL